MQQKDCYVIGYASALGGPNPTGSEGPLAMQRSGHIGPLEKTLHWGPVLQPKSGTNRVEAIAEICQELAKNISACVRDNQFFIVLGGDHTSAIGTWSGALQEAEGPLGLIWIDAHMDSHTPETTQTGNIHGMPLATLLGKGPQALTELAFKGAKIRPENLCLIGVRSFEPAEKAFLEERNVRIFYMDEINSKGLDQVIHEAIRHVSKHAKRFGLSIDIDSVDPLDAPGTGVPEPNGLSGAALVQALKQIRLGPEWIGAEIVEFDPSRDHNQKTEKLIAQMLSVFSGR